MTFTARDKAAARAIISCFETGKPNGNYAAVAVLADGAGISYGCHQATHDSGALLAVVKAFITRTVGSELAVALLPYLGRLQSKAYIKELAADRNLHNLLRRAGRTPEMRAAQDEVFDEKYMSKALAACEGSGFTRALTLAVMYDSHIHGSWATIRDRVPSDLSEQKWVNAYVQARKSWLATHRKTILRKTIYRMEAFERLIVSGNWSLATPFTVRGVRITDAHLGITLPLDMPEAVTEKAEESKAKESEDTVKPLTIFERVADAREQAQNVMTSVAEVRETVEGATDTAGRVVETAQTVQAFIPVIGGGRDDSAKNVTNPLPTRIALSTGGVYMLLQTIKAWAADNALLLSACVLSVAAMVCVYMTIRYLTNRDRREIAADPNKINVH